MPSVSIRDTSEPRHELSRHPVGDLFVVSVGRVVRLQVTVPALNTEEVSDASHDGVHLALATGGAGQAGVRGAERLWGRLPRTLDTIVHHRRQGFSRRDGFG
jgi:hypothetical protein